MNDVRLRLLAALFVLGLIFHAAPQPARAAEVIFHEDFKGVMVDLPGLGRKLYPDPAKWAFTYWPGTVWPDSFGDGTNWLAANGECQAYLTPFITKVKGKAIPARLRHDPFTITAGGLAIEAKLLTEAQRSAYGLASYQRFGSGMLLSRFSFTYGSVRMVAKLPKARGSWPAFWMLPLARNWPPEIDILEGMAWGKHKKEMSSALLVPSADGLSPLMQHWYPVNVDLSSSYNEYRLDWSETTMSGYFNGQRLWQVPTPPSMKQPMYMIINFGVGGRWPYNVLGIQPNDGMSAARLNAGSDLIQGDYSDWFHIKSVTVLR